MPDTRAGKRDRLHLDTDEGEAERPACRRSERQVVEGSGIFDYVEADMPIELGERKHASNDLRALVSGREPILSIDRQIFPTTAGEPRQGDLVEFPSKPDLPRFEIVSVRRDGQSRMVLRLVER